MTERLPYIMKTIWCINMIIWDNDLKTTEADLMKLERKIKHTEKVCSTQELSLYTQGQGHSWVKGCIVL